MKPTKVQQSINFLPNCFQPSQNSCSGPTEQKKKFEIAGTEFIVDTRYDVLKQIGSGAYGVVVSAIDRTTNTKFAIKKVPIG
jgi:mitogen-activated protein kinase 1/3